MILSVWNKNPRTVQLGIKQKVPLPSAQTHLVLRNTRNITHTYSYATHVYVLNNHVYKLLSNLLF